MLTVLTVTSQSRARELHRLLQNQGKKKGEDFPPQKAKPTGRRSKVAAPGNQGRQAVQKQGSTSQHSRRQAADRGSVPPSNDESSSSGGDRARQLVLVLPALLSPPPSTHKTQKHFSLDRLQLLAPVQSPMQSFAILLASSIRFNLATVPP